MTIHQGRHPQDVSMNVLFFFLIFLASCSADTKKKRNMRSSQNIQTSEDSENSGSQSGDNTVENSENSNTSNNSGDVTGNDSGNSDSNNSGNANNGSGDDTVNDSGNNKPDNSGEGHIEGAKLYQSYCKNCHGSLEKSVKKGATVESIKLGMEKNAMKPLKSKLNDQELKAIEKALSVPDTFLTRLIPQDLENYCKGFSGNANFWNNGIKDPAKIACFSGIDAALASIPKIIRSYFNIMVNSESAQKGTADKPRIIINTPWGGDGNFVLATSTHPNSNKNLEVIAWDGKEYRWKPLGIDFSKSPPALENSSCKTCHGRPFKAIWGGYLNWPGAIDHNGNLNGNIEDGSVQKRDLLSKYMKDTNSYLKHLEFRDNYDNIEFESVDPLINNTKMSKVLMMIIVSNLIDAYVNKILSDKNLTNNQILEFVWRSSCRHKWRMGGADLGKIPRVMTQYRSAYLKLNEYAQANYTDPYERLGPTYRWQDNLRVSKLNSKGTFEYIRVSNVRGTYLDSHINNKLLYRMNLRRPALKLAEKLPALFSDQKGLRSQAFEFWNPELTMVQWRAKQNASRASLDRPFFLAFNGSVLDHFEGEALGKYTETCNKIKELACEGRNSCLQY